MVTSPSIYPMWTMSVLLPRGVPRTYKYIKWSFKRFQWEDLKTRMHRTITPDGSTFTVNDRFGQCDEPEEPPALPAVKSVASKRLILVAFHLPIKLRQTGVDAEGREQWEGEWDQDNIAAKTEDSVSKDIEVTWIGAVTHANVTGDWFGSPSAERLRAVNEACKAMNCVPIFLEQSVYTNHYSLFCKKRLWDIFHNVVRPQISDDGSGYDGYVQGNKLFAHAVFEHLKEPSDIVWVHDYHLMLVPKMLRAVHAGPVIFYLHVPFPTSEIFRTLTVRHELLEGMLSASTIGFHTFNHGRHFLTACRRFLGAQSRSVSGGMLAVEHRDRRVLITISHLGVDPTRVDAAQSTDESRELARSIRASGTHPDQVVFASIDELQRLRGVPLKLLAFERLLSTTGRWQHGRARFVQWTMRKGARQEDVARSAVEVRILVDRINAAFGPVVELKEFDKSDTPTIRQRVGLWLAADVFVNTAVGEGLNLMPLEYMYTRGNMDSEPGAVIISEFSAGASVLNGAIRVNCYDIGSIAKAMDETARMPRSERLARRDRDRTYLTSTSSQWSRYIIKEVLTALDDDTFTTIGQNRTVGGVALPHVVQCKPLDLHAVLDAYRASKRRVLLLDFGGTLVEEEQENLTLKRDFLGVAGRGLSESMKRTLATLCADPRNVVFIVSGLSRTVLMRVFSDLLETNTSLGIVAHSGLCVMYPPRNTSSEARGSFSVLPQQATVSLVADKMLLHNNAAAHAQEQPTMSVDQQLQDWVMTSDLKKEGLWEAWIRDAGILPILQQFTWTTGGSVIRTSPITTLWDYTRSDPEWGHNQANMLVTELEKALEANGMPVVVKHTKGTVQLLPKDVNKGMAALHIFESLKTSQWGDEGPDFCLCVGDDLSDELMFGGVHRYFAQAGLTHGVFTTTVGRKPTAAQNYLRDVDAVRDLLNRLVADYDVA